MSSRMCERVRLAKIDCSADFYDSGNPFEDEFIQGWNWIEQLYGDLNCPQKGRVLQFIAELRKAGYDRKLRAGQSLFTFIVFTVPPPRTSGGTILDWFSLRREDYGCSMEEQQGYLWNSHCNVQSS
jgi:hypothetical protein